MYLLEGVWALRLNKVNTTHLSLSFIYTALGEFHPLRNWSEKQLRTSDLYFGKVKVPGTNHSSQAGLFNTLSYQDISDETRSLLHRHGGCLKRSAADIRGSLS